MASRGSKLEFFYPLVETAKVRMLHKKHDDTDIGILHAMAYIEELETEQSFVGEIVSEHIEWAESKVDCSDLRNVVSTIKDQTKKSPDQGA